MLTLRTATLDDVPRLKAWDQDPDVQAAVGSNGATDWETEVSQQVDWGETLIAEVDGRPIGFLRIIDPAKEESHYWGEVGPGLRAIDIWVGAAADRARGIGARMMSLALDRCFAAEGVQAVIIDPLETNVRACRFYERLGFRFVERRRFGDDDCVVYRLNRQAWLAGA